MMLDVFAAPPQVRRAPYGEPARPGPKVVVYGNRWCGLTQMVARTLARTGVDYDYVDLDEQPAVRARLQHAMRGRLRTPVVYVDGRWLVAPSTAELRHALLGTRMAA